MTDPKPVRYRVSFEVKLAGYESLKDVEIDMRDCIDYGLAPEAVPEYVLVERVERAAIGPKLKTRRRTTSELLGELIESLREQAECNDLDREVYEMLVKCGAAEVDENGYFVMKEKR